MRRTTLQERLNAFGVDWRRAPICQALGIFAEAVDLAVARGRAVDRPIGCSIVTDDRVGVTWIDRDGESVEEQQQGKHAPFVR